jgi:hypothetical protein
MAQQFLLPGSVPSDPATADKVLARFVRQASLVLNALIRSGVVSPTATGFEVAGAGAGDPFSQRLYAYRGSAYGQTGY